jgi:aminoglycoside 6'-N-acetyltransferase I
VGVEVRRATTADIPGWAAGRADLWPSLDAEGHREELVAFLDADGVFAWVAVEDGAVIGFLEAAIRAYANGCTRQPVLFVDGAWVREDWRRRGIGKAMLDALLAFARERGFDEICTDSDLENTEAHAAFEALGFRETERVVYFRRETG